MAANKANSSSAWVVEEDLEPPHEGDNDDFEDEEEVEEIEDDEALEQFVQAESTPAVSKKNKSVSSSMIDDDDPEDKIKSYYTTHNSEEKTWFTCKACAEEGQKEYKTDFNSTMRDHINSQHMRIMLKCTHCQFETLRFKTLNLHRRNKHNLSAMPCLVERCGFKTILIERLRDHMAKKHDMTRDEAKERIANRLTNEALANCNLDDELQYNSGKPQRMPTSRTHWASGWKRERSSRKTDEERQYKIVFDDVTGKMKGVQCLHCDFSTRLPSNMPGHVNAKHLGKQLKCPECAFSTFYPKNLSVHMKKLHGRNTRKCLLPPCKFKCVQDERMHIHLMEKHNCIYDEVKNAIYIDI